MSDHARHGAVKSHSWSVYRKQPAAILNFLHIVLESYSVWQQSYSSSSRAYFVIQIVYILLFSFIANS